jgi:hypothetical protein
MAKMLEYLQKKYPNTVSRFISDVTFNKYINLNEFEEMDFGSRYILVKGFFGYERRYDTDMSVCLRILKLLTCGIRRECLIS